MKISSKRIILLSSLILLQMVFINSSAHAADLILCVNKISRVVTYPTNSKCAANQITLNVMSNVMVQPKSHTTTAAIVPKSKVLKVFVPNVLAKSLAQAQSDLSALGLKVAIKYVNKTASSKVIQVVPKPGTQVTPGSIVTLVVG